MNAPRPIDTVDPIDPSDASEPIDPIHTTLPIPIHPPGWGSAFRRPQRIDENWACL
jgi:hypothetical protein